MTLPASCNTQSMFIQTIWLFHRYKTYALLYVSKTLCDPYRRNLTKNKRWKRAGGGEERAKSTMVLGT